MAVRKITIRAVVALKPGEMIWDDTVKGFGVRRQRNAAVYVFKYRHKGRQRFMTIGRHGSPWTPEEARAIARQHLVALAGKDQPHDPATRQDGARPSFGQFAETYLTQYATVRKKIRSVAEDRRNLELHILPVLGSLELTSINRQDVAQFHAGQHARPTNANRCLALISHIFTIAEKWGLREVGTNPCRGLGRYREKARERFLKKEEIAALGDVLKAAESTVAEKTSTKGGRAEDGRAIGCLRLLIYTGARLNEILSLEWSWINWDGGFVRLPDSKTGAKTVVLPGPALALLKALHEKRRHDQSVSKFVFPGQHRDSYFTGIQKPWQRLRALAGLHNVRIHDLRHSFASMAVAGGESLYLVGTILGHRQTATTQRYAHLAIEPIREVADRTAGRIAAILDPASRPYGG